MTLEELNARKLQLENDINQLTNQVYIFHGHKQEVEYQITLLKQLEVSSSSDQCEAVDNLNDNPVE